VTNPQRIITRLCRFPRLYRDVQQLSADCLVFFSGQLVLFRFTLTVLIHIVLNPSRKRSPKKSIHCTLPVRIRRQTETVSDLLVNTVEHLAAKETHISQRSWWRLSEPDPSTVSRSVLYMCRRVYPLCFAGRPYLPNGIAMMLISLRIRQTGGETRQLMSLFP